MNGASFLQYSLTLEDADQHYDDQGGYADADEDVYVFQRNLAEFLVEILKGIQLAAVGAVGFLFGLGSSLFFAHRLLLRQVLAQVKGNGDDDDKALCNVCLLYTSTNYYTKPRFRCKD